LTIPKPLAYLSVMDHVARLAVWQETLRRAKADGFLTFVSSDVAILRLDHAEAPAKTDQAARCPEPGDALPGFEGRGLGDGQGQSPDIGAGPSGH
jgi:hypothetical protein